MKAKKFTIDGTENGEVNLPKQFSEEFRPDLIKRAAIAIQSHNRQAYGASPDDGTRDSAYVSKRRKAYFTEGRPFTNTKGA